MLRGMTPHTNRLPADWRSQPDHILYNWLDFSCNDWEHALVMEELTDRRHARQEVQS